MNSLLFACSVGAFLIATMGLWSRADGLVKKIYPWVPLPALILGIISIVNSETSISEFPNILLGARIGLDELGRAFLILTSSVWLLAGIFSRNYFASTDQAHLFRFYFLASYSGALGLTIAHDAPMFYAGYALMTISGYGLVIQTKTEAAHLAARVYMVVALIGEMLTLAGLIIAASTAPSFAITDIAQSIHSSPLGEWSFWLIFTGFGTKVGLVPLHFWLPRSYYWASLPAVAVLSGAMTKAGLLGWLRFLPPPEGPTASILIVAAGAVMAFYGVFFGVVQTRAKTTLAFSSLSQMGYLTMAFATLMEPSAPRGLSLAAIVGFAFHHGITKVALFLGVGALARFPRRGIARGVVFAGLIVGALALVGFPFTGGAYAKMLLKSAGAENGFWHSIASPLMTIGSIATALLMLRFIVLCARGEHDQAPPAKEETSWSLAFLAVLLGGWLLPPLLESLEIALPQTVTVWESLKSFLPVAIGSVVAGALTHKLWLKHSHLTPRPFDTILQKVYKAVWEDLPRDLNLYIRYSTKLFARLKLRLKLKRKADFAVDLARRAQTSWILSTTLFMAIGVALWIFLAGGEYDL